VKEESVVSCDTRSSLRSGGQDVNSKTVNSSYLIGSGIFEPRQMLVFGHELEIAVELKRNQRDD
jgi:hypothetical protein